MYLPPHFEETDPSQIYELIDEFPLAVLVAQTEQGIVANHIPLMLQEKQELLGHLALNNDLHQLVSSGQEVLTIFRGEDAYISPNWYPTKPIHPSMYRPGTIRLCTFMEKNRRKIQASCCWETDKEDGRENQW